MKRIEHHAWSKAVSMVVGALATIALPACEGGKGVNLQQASDRLALVVADVRDSVVGLGARAADVNVSDPLECRTGLNKRNGTAQITYSFQVTEMGSEAASAMVATVADALTRAGAAVEIEEEPDMDRPQLRGRRGDERFAVDFGFADGGSTATVTAATGCHDMTDG